MASNIQKRADEAREIIRAQMKQIELIAGDKKKASLVSSAIMELAQNKNLVNCSVESVVNTALSIVRAGLNPNPLFGEAYVVPFRTKNGEVAQLQIGYKGYVKIGYRNGWIFKTRPVFDCDQFEVVFDDFDEKFVIVPNYDERNEDDGEWVHKHLKGVVVLAKDGSGNTFREFVAFRKLEKIRLRSQNQKSPDRLDFIWKDWAIEMYSAKALKYVMKRLPITEEMTVLIGEDERFEHDDHTKKIAPEQKPEFSFGKKDEIDVSDVEVVDEQS